jgi:hypothetical protein
VLKCVCLLEHSFFARRKNTWLVPRCLLSIIDHNALINPSTKTPKWQKRRSGYFATQKNQKLKFKEY